MKAHDRIRLIAQRLVTVKKERLRRVWCNRDC